MKVSPMLLPALVVLLAVSCTSGHLQPQYNSKRAEETLALTLEAWKQGHAATLAKRKPSIRFEDEDHRNGLRLLDYRLEQSEIPLGPFSDVRVMLSLRDRKGNKVEKTVAYQVTLEPNLAVIRND